MCSQARRRVEWCMISQKKRLLMSCNHNLVSSDLVHPIKNAEKKREREKCWFRTYLIMLYFVSNCIQSTILFISLEQRRKPQLPFELSQIISFWSSQESGVLGVEGRQNILYNDRIVHLCRWIEHPRVHEQVSGQTRSRSLQDDLVYEQTISKRFNRSNARDFLLV